MSSIFGIFRMDWKSVDNIHLLQMGEVNAPFGRDGQDIYIDGRIGLGCCLSRFGLYSQSEVPIYRDENAGLVVACDALVWNRAELLKEFGISDSATTQALLARAYLEYGEECPKMINGDFVFAVFDSRNGTLFLARDHLGIRPLYYFYDGVTFAFSTDYRALLSLPFVDKKLDEIKLYADLSGTYIIDTEATYFERIKRLPQAHALSVGKDGLLKTRYWAPGENGKVVCATDKEYANKLYELVEDAVKRRVLGVTGKIGAELSGGLDSTVMTILANRALKSTGGSLSTLYSWSPSWERLPKKKDDERVRIDAVCRQEGLVCAYDDPSDPIHADYDGMPIPEAPWGGYILIREEKVLSSHGVNIVLSGYGGDEAASLRTGLYQILREGYLGYFLKQVRWLSKGSALRFGKLIVSNTVRQWFRPYARFGRENKETPHILKPDFEKQMKKRRKKDILYYSVDAKKHIQAGVIQARTEPSAYLDAENNMLHLYPLMDYRVVDFALSIPRHVHYRHGVNRFVFRNAFAGILPAEYGVFFTKDDPAKSEQLTGRISIDDLKQELQKVDRESLDIFVDWALFEKAIESCDLQKNMRTYFFLRYKINTCLDIGRSLKSAGD